MKVRELMQRDVTTVAENEPLGLALQVMGWNGVRHLPVVRDGRVVGIVSERDVLARRDPEDVARVHGTVAEAMSSPVKVSFPHMDVEEAAAILVAERIEALPVVEEGRLVGILTSTDLLGSMAQCTVTLTEEPTIASVMVRRVEAAYADDSLAEAATRMAKRGIRHLPVVDGLRRVRGIVSDRDIRETVARTLVDIEAAERSAYVRSLRIGDVMAHNPRTVRADEPIAAAVRAFVDDRFGALPVVDEDDRLVGILSYIDLLRFLGARLEEEARPMQAEARA